MALHATIVVDGIIYTTYHVNFNKMKALVSNDKGESWIIKPNPTFPVRRTHKMFTVDGAI